MGPDSTNEETYEPLTNKNCESQFADMNMEVTKRAKRDVLPNGLCMNGEHAIVEGSVLTGVEQSFQVRFQHCTSRSDLSGVLNADGSPLVCMGLNESQDWIKEKRPSYDVFFSFNFLDFAEKGDYYKKGLTTVAMGQFTGMTTKSVYVPLKMNVMSVEDEILNPFDYDSEEYYYISTIINLAEAESTIVMPENNNNQADTDNGQDDAINEDSAV